MATLKKGKRPFVPDHRDFKLTDVVDVEAILPKVPASFGHETAFALEMYGNGPDPSVYGDGKDFEGAGDCVFAGACEETHLVEHAAARPMATLTGKEAIAAYSAVTGYVLGDDATDQGTDVRQALAWRRKTGLKDAAGKRHKIGAYLSLEPGNLSHVLAATHLFGAVGIGFQFPSSAMSQFHAGKPWSVVAGAQIEGGHYVPLVARRHSSSIQVLTWARNQTMTNTFFERYCEEAWAIVPTEYLNVATGKTPEGFDQAQLVKMLSAL